MAFSLRKRLGRKTGPTDPKAPSDENPTSSSESSLASTSKDATNPIAKDDLSTTPPPPRRKLRSSKDLSRDRTPPQSLLQKYQSKTAGQALPALSTEAVEGRKDSSVNEASVEAFATSPTREKRPAAAESKKTGETRRVKGVQFDMVGQSGSDASKSKTSSAEAVRHGPTTQQASSGHRRTRSRARREEREKAGEDVLSDGLAALKLDASLEPPPLSVRKVDRTPSPRGDEVDRDGYGEMKGKVEASPVVDDNFTSRSEETSDNTELEKKENSSHHERHNAIDHAVSTLISFPPPTTTAAGANTTIKEPHPPSSAPKETAQTPKIKSILKASPPNTQNSNLSNLRLPVSPPRTPLPGTLAGYVFCSDKSCSSRPSEPWAWCRRWTCCSCGDGKEHVLGLGGERPAMTMAEQKVCSRLSCGHVRCGGCRLEFRAR